MKIKLIFGRTAHDETTAWTDTKSVEVDVPDYLGEESQCCKYHLIGAIMPDGYDDWSEYDADS